MSWAHLNDNNMVEFFIVRRMGMVERSEGRGAALHMCIVLVIRAIKKTFTGLEVPKLAPWAVKWNKKGLLFD